MGWGQWFGWSGTWKEHNWKTGDKEVWGRGIRIDLSEWAKHMKTFVSYVTAHQRVTSVEEDFINQEDKMTRPVAPRQPLFSATPVIAQWTHEQRGCGGRDGGDTWAQQHGLNSSRPTWLQPLLSAQSTSSRNQY